MPRHRFDQSSTVWRASRPAGPARFFDGGTLGRTPGLDRCAAGGCRPLPGDGAGGVRSSRPTTHGGHSIPKPRAEQLELSGTRFEAAQNKTCGSRQLSYPEGNVGVLQGCSTRNASSSRQNWVRAAQAQRYIDTAQLFSLWAGHRCLRTWRDDRSESAPKRPTHKASRTVGARRKGRGWRAKGGER